MLREIGRILKRRRTQSRLCVCTFLGPNTDLTLPDPAYFAEICCCCLNYSRNVFYINSLLLKMAPVAVGCRLPATWQTDLLNFSWGPRWCGPASDVGTATTDAGTALCRPDADVPLPAPLAPWPPPPISPSSACPVSLSDCHLPTYLQCKTHFNMKREDQQDATIRCLLLTSVSTCFEHHYAHLQENKGPVTAFGVCSNRAFVLLKMAISCSHPTTQRPTTATNHIQQNQNNTPNAVTKPLFSWRWA